ncbi:immunoglobulin-binding protein 1 [Parambassis ranga]|uniref:immunoglobulin-binding protein 1 n=1 Tax=Parambassis ranga TaxID=210632 RepID=UPI001041F6D0|nr:immunoglobulin-binding protein 1 [Parambassis ranga]
MAERDNNQDVRRSVSSDTESPKLSDLLDRGWKIFEKIDGTDEPLGSRAVQLKVKEGINMLMEASKMIAELNLFSRNEELEEIATADLKYLLLPALLGALTLKQTSQDTRLDIVNTARVYFMDFLLRCKQYDVSQFELPKSASENDDASEHERSKTKSPHSQPDLVTMATQRQAKIERYRQKKELEEKLSDVRRAVDSGQADDEVTRDFYLLNIRRWITVCLEEIESINQEQEILKKMDVLKQSTAKQSSLPVRRPMKPFILTKGAVQAQVFGAGYPSLPTMTVDDWYEQHRKQGALPDQGIPRRVALEDDTDVNERDEEKKEKDAENDTEDALLKARNWDDWKDTHRRGYGNRQNMG